MKTLLMCLVLGILATGCGIVHAMVIDEGAILKQKEATHRIAVRGQIEIAKKALDQGLPANVHAQDLESDGQAGYNWGMGGMYGVPGMMPGMYGMPGLSPTAAFAEAASLGQGQGFPPPQFGPQATPQGQPVAQSVATSCPENRKAEGQAEEIACLKQDRATTAKRLARLEHK